MSHSTRSHVLLIAVALFAIGCTAKGSTSTPMCAAALTRCSGACVDVSTDPTHCGKCGTECDPGQACVDGACTLTCAGGTTRCGERCVDTQIDPANCGGCGAPCSASQVCTAGKCNAAACGSSLTACPSLSGAICVSTQTDNANCGACGNICPSGQSCSSGQCTLTCGALTKCVMGASAYCANTQTDNANCGGCGNACPSGTVCASGTCALTCGTLTSCVPDAGADGAYCANTDTDNTNCGSCGNACSSGQMCAGGSCGLTCGALATCTPNGSSPYCANTQTDNANCGGCGAQCTGNTKCIGGQCLSPVLWSDGFVGGTSSTAQQCTTWNDFRGKLTASRTATFTGMRIYGSALPDPIRCDDPVATREFAEALRTLTSTMITCGGHTWSLCGTRYSGEVWLDPPALCSPSNCPNPGNIIRPCIVSSVWGGFNSATCSAPSQTMGLEFN